MPPGPNSQGNTAMSELLYRHKTRGTLYRILLRGKMQLKRPDDMARIVVYESVTAPGEIWVRRETEFFNGLFEPVIVENADPLTETIYRVVAGFKLSNMCYEDSDDLYPLLDAMSAPDATLESGEEQAGNLAAEIAAALRLHIATLLAEAEAQGLRRQQELAAGIAHASNMLSQHLEKYWDQEELPAEAKELREIMHHLQGCLIEDSDTFAPTPSQPAGGASDAG